MSLPRTEAEKLRPSFEHNKDKLKMKTPSVGEVWQNRTGKQFTVVALANAEQLEGFSNLFPLTVIYKATSDVRKEPALGARHLIAWDMVMKFVKSGKPKLEPCNCPTCANPECPCACHSEGN